jgi:small neutral amino acid transporter SnatA (MarC family)
MRQELTLFVGMFTTLLAIINPLEALPVLSPMSFHHMPRRLYFIIAPPHCFLPLQSR